MKKSEIDNMAERIAKRLDDENPKWRENYKKIPPSNLSHKQQLKELYKLVENLENGEQK